MHASGDPSAHRHAGSATGIDGEPPQAPTLFVVGVVAAGPLNGKLVASGSAVPPVQLSKMIVPRLATGSVSAVPVGSTSPTPFSHLKSPANERISTDPPAPNPPVATKSPRANTEAVSKRIG